ncbi:MAG TPA: ABC transporter permease [Burkholderiales bacterium]|nr:ABC transporter permease [Burkholderiales bacterium]
MISTIAAKELKSLFASPLAWIVLTAVQLAGAMVFLRQYDRFIEIQPQQLQLGNAPGVTEFIATPLFTAMAVVLLLAVPLLAMRAIAEERRNQTMVLLTSAPLTMTQIVVGKFCGLAVFLVLVIALVSAMPLSLAPSTALDYGLLASLCAGLLILALGFAAVSLFLSSLTVHPMGAAFAAFAALLLMLLLGEAAADGLRAKGWLVPAALVQVFSPLKNFEPFIKGVIDTYAIACGVLLALFFIVLTVRRLDSRRLRG